MDRLINWFVVQASDVISKDITRGLWEKIVVCFEGYIARAYVTNNTNFDNSPVIFENRQVSDPRPKARILKYISVMLPKNVAQWNAQN